MRHVQRTLLPDSRPEYLAEVFLSGLLRRTTPDRTDILDDNVQYDYLPHIRDLLLSTVPVDEALQVLKVVNDYFAESNDESFDIRAILADPAQAASRACRLVVGLRLGSLGARSCVVAMTCPTPGSRPYIPTPVFAPG